MKEVAVLYGGYSKEAQISFKSASMVMANIDRGRFQPTLVRIDEENWQVEEAEKVYPIDKNDFSYNVHGKKKHFDLLFNMIHGTPGEDGLLTGYFEMMGLRHTNGSVLNMALTFDKEATKSMLSRNGINTAKSKLLRSDEVYSRKSIITDLGLPCFVKPNRGGSSFGASKVDREEELLIAIEKAFEEDELVLVESFIKGRECSCGVIMTRGRARSLPITEIISEAEFFDFAAKYEGKSQEITPAEIPQKIYQRIQQLTEEICELLECKGVARVDYLIREEEIFVIEVNTVPGFSEASIVPQQAAADGISEKELISLIIDSVLMD